MSFNNKEYDRWRNSLECNLCGERHYRRGFCRSCYKENQKKSFHCTHTGCTNPVFGSTLCQRHYRSYRQRCLICASRYVYYRHLCRTHYRQCSKTGDFPLLPICDHTGCVKEAFLEDLCLVHFKQKYKPLCNVADCHKKIHRKGLCCTHYFRHRREEEKKSQR